MKTTIFLMIALFSSLALSASAQDTLKANPDTVTLKFENERVRVLESVVKPGGKDREHSHPNYVTYVISGGKFRVHSGNTAKLGEFKTGEILFRNAQTHWAENIGKTTNHVIMFELKEGTFPGEPYKVPPDQDPVKLSPQYYKILVDNEYVRVLERRLKPGQKEQMHSGTCRVVYNLTGSTSKVTTPDGKVTTRKNTAGEIVWRGPTTHAIENVGRTEARTIVIEIKGPCNPTQAQ